MGVRNEATDAIATVTTYGSGAWWSAWASASATGPNSAVVAEGTYGGTAAKSGQVTYTASLP